MARNFPDITSKGCLDAAFEKAKSWCSENLAGNLDGFDGNFDYGIFAYLIDNAMAGPDMAFDSSGTIRVSTDKLAWYLERESFFTDNPCPRLFRGLESVVEVSGGSEVDPESMFVHEMAEFIVMNSAGVWMASHLRWKIHPYRFSETPHLIARHIEHTNRVERGLKPWPYD